MTGCEWHLRDVETGVCSVCGAPDPGPGELREHQPPVDSIVLAEGARGTAWQRMSSTGIWHSTAGRRATWSELVKRDRPAARIRVVYVPPKDSNALES